MFDAMYDGYDPTNELVEDPKDDFTLMLETELAYIRTLQDERFKIMSDGSMPLLARLEQTKQLTAVINSAVLNCQYFEGER